MIYAANIIDRSNCLERKANMSMKNRLVQFTEAIPTITAQDLTKMTYEERQTLIRRLQQEVEDDLRQLSSSTANIYFVQN